MMHVMDIFRGGVVFLIWGLLWVIDGDGKVDLTDFSYLGVQWLSEGSAVPSADIWPTCGGDGIVDMHDLILMVNYFLESE